MCTEESQQFKSLQFHVISWNLHALCPKGCSQKRSLTKQTKNTEGTHRPRSLRNILLSLSLKGLLNKAAYTSNAPQRFLTITFINLTLIMWLACPTVTIAPLLEDMEAPEKSFLRPSAWQDRDQTSEMMAACAKHETKNLTRAFFCFTFSEDSVEPINRMLIAGGEAQIQCWITKNTCKIEH